MRVKVRIRMKGRVRVRVRVGLVIEFISDYGDETIRESVSVWFG